jgi:hypothetical protein
VILKDDELNTPTPNSKATTDPSKPTNLSTHRQWCDIEDGGYINNNFCLIPLLKQEGLASTSIPAQGQPYSLHYSLRPLQDQINQHSNNRTIQCTLEEPGPYSLSALLDENSRGDSKEKTVSKLEKDLLLAFKEQENLSFTPTPSSLCPYRPSTKPLHP